MIIEFEIQATLLGGRNLLVPMGQRSESRGGLTKVFENFRHKLISLRMILTWSERYGSGKYILRFYFTLHDCKWV